MILVLELTLDNVHGQTALLLQNTLNITSVAGYIRNLFLKTGIDINLMESFSYAINKVRSCKESHPKFVRYQKDYGPFDKRGDVISYAAPTIDRQHFNVDTTIYIDINLDVTEQALKQILDVTTTLKLQGGHNKILPKVLCFNTFTEALETTKNGLMVSLRNESFSNDLENPHYFESIIEKYFSREKREPGIFGLMHTHYITLTYLESYSKNNKIVDFYNRLGEKGLYICEAGFNIVEYIPIQRPLKNHQFNYGFDSDAFYIKTVSSNTIDCNDDSDDDFEF